MSVLPKLHLTSSIYKTPFLFMIVLRFFSWEPDFFPEMPNIMSGCEDTEGD